MFVPAPLLMLLRGDGGAWGGDGDGGGGMLRRGGDGGTKFSLVIQSFLISLIQCFSSMAWNAHVFNEPTLLALGINSCKFLTIDFRLLNKTPPGFLLCCIQHAKSFDGIYSIEFRATFPAHSNCLAAIILRASGMLKNFLRIAVFLHDLL